MKTEMEEKLTYLKAKIVDEALIEHNAHTNIEAYTAEIRRFWGSCSVHFETNVAVIEGTLTRDQFDVILWVMENYESDARGIFNLY